MGVRRKGQTRNEQDTVCKTCLHAVWSASVQLPSCHRKHTVLEFLLPGGSCRH